MSNDFFGQLVFFTFVTVPTSEDKVRDKRVTLATIHCHRSTCDDYAESFRTHNKNLGEVYAEFSFKEVL